LRSCTQSFALAGSVARALTTVDANDFPVTKQAVFSPRGLPTAGVLAAVDPQDLAGHEGRMLEIEDRVDDVGDLAHAADWMELRERLVGRLGVHRCLDDAGATALTRTPRLANSMASERVTALSAPLVSAASAAGTPAIGCLSGGERITLYELVTDRVTKLTGRGGDRPPRSHRTDQ
jgi:hypothetical protein